MLHSKIIGLGLLLGWSLSWQVRADDKSTDPLSVAVEKGDVAALKTLLDQGADVNKMIHGQGYVFTPLTDAAGEGQLEALKYLISRGAKLDLPDNEGSTALLHACYENRTDCALALIDAGANVNIASNGGMRTPLMYAAQKGNDKIVAALIAHKADLNANCGGGPAILWAASEDKLSTVKLIGAAGADANLAPNPADPKVLSVVGLGAAFGDVEMVEYALGLGVPVDGADGQGRTPLMKAADHNYPKVAALLLDKGARIDAQDNDGNTALMLSQNVDVMQVLLERGANKEVQNKKGMTALIVVAPYNNTALAQMLIDKGADINAADLKANTALTWAGDRGNFYVVDMLRAKGARSTHTYVIDKEDPPQVMSPAHRWALAVGQIYTQRDGLNPKILGGGESVINFKRMLERDWKITDGATLVNQLNSLHDHGHHTLYQDAGAKMALMSDDDFQKLLEGHADHAVEIKAMRASYVKWKDKSGLAWDLSRAARLVNDGFAVGYINEREAWERLMGIARQAQSSFGSWQEFSDNFLDGREIWANQRDPRFESCAQLLLNANDANSPWNQFPWKTDLSGE